MTLDDRDIAALTFLARKARPFGARRWDEAGIIAAVEKLRTWSLAGAMVECGLAAADATAETPGVIGTNGPHRRVAIPTPPRQPEDPRATRCTWCKRTVAGHPADHKFHQPEPPMPPGALSAGIAAFREDRPVTKAPTPPKTLDDLRDTKPELAARLARIAAVVPAVAMREVEA